MIRSSQGTESAVLQMASLVSSSMATSFLLRCGLRASARRVRTCEWTCDSDSTSAPGSVSSG